MRTDFVDKLRFNPYPKLFIDKQPITRRVFISSKKLKEIRSRLVCEEYTLNLLHNGDEKKDEKVEDEKFIEASIIVIDHLLGELREAESFIFKKSIYENNGNVVRGVLRTLREIEEYLQERRKEQTEKQKSL